jgi:hypothetical protein
MFGKKLERQKHPLDEKPLHIRECVHRAKPVVSTLDETGSIGIPRAVRVRRLAIQVSLEHSLDDAHAFDLAWLRSSRSPAHPAAGMESRLR